MRKEIVGCLTDRGYDVFTDVDKLRVGDEWNPVLFEEMYLCDVAIVLLGPNTITSSDWVRREAEVLMGRHAVRSLATVLPVFVGTRDTKEARRRGFGALLKLQAELGERPSNPLPDDPGPGGYADWLAAEFAPVTPPAGVARDFHLWSSRIAAFLKSARLHNADTLVDAATALCRSAGEVVHHVRAKVGAELFLAHVLLKEGEKVRSEDEASALPEALAALRPGLAGSQLHQLRHEVLPGWVAPADAEAFTPPLPGAGAEHRRVVLLDAYAAWTAEQHVRRTVFNAPARYRLSALPADEDVVADEASGEEALMALCRATLPSVFALPPNAPLKPGWVRQDGQAGEYLVVDATGREFADVAAVVNRVHDDYPWLTIVVLVSEGVPPPEVLADLGMARAVTVRPGSGVEHRAYKLNIALADIAGGI